MGNGGNRGQLRTAGGRSIFMKYAITKCHLTSTLFMWNSSNRGQIRTTGGRSIFMQYVNRENYFTKSHLKRRQRAISHKESKVDFYEKCR